MENQSCRILTISSTIKGAVAFIESVKALAASRSASSAPPSSSVDKSSVPLTVPWTIRNRYYVADVHFSAWTVDRLFPDLFDRQPPALVFVWYEGEPYIKHVKEIARLIKLREYEPDVALAVRIPGTDSSPEVETVDSSSEGSQNESENENGDIDSVLMSYGFEYVDATRPLETDLENGMDDDIPALPRVVDALSTIIWPSMRSNKVEPGVGGPKATLDLNQSFDEIDSEDENLEKEKESMIQELLDETKGNVLSFSPFSSVDGDQELMEQMKAMVLNTETRRQWERPWVSVSASSSTTGTVSEMTMSPAEIGYGGKPFDGHLGLELTDAEQGSVKKKVSLRFEDDFSVFVSAPAEEGAGKTASLGSTGFLEPDAGFRYRTLGSVSDFGGSDDGREGSYDRLDDEDAREDDGMPSKKEIRDTAHKIFGGAPCIANPGEDSGAFDLEQVFGVLQEYKTEIAGMENEEAKRKSAARVALGLVYGLEGGV